MKYTSTKKLKKESAFYLVHDSRTVVEDTLYVFGGYTEQYIDGDVVQGHSNHLFMLNLRTLKWRRLPQDGVRPWRCPLPVYMTCLVHHRGYLYTFGGEVYMEDKQGF